MSWKILFLSAVVASATDGLMEMVTDTPIPVDDKDESQTDFNRYGSSNDEIEIDRFTYFDTELIQKLHKEYMKNIVISPASIKTMLGLILEGAEGKSAKQLIDVMRLPNNKTEAKKKLHNFQKQMENSRPHLILKSANRVLVAKNVNLKPAYRVAVGEKYSAEVVNANFASPESAANEINEWVTKITQGFIPMLIQPDSLDSSSQIVLVNAMYFKGEWQSKFDTKLTVLDCFYSTKNECTRTRMMTQEGYFKYGYIKALNARVLELPYSDERYSMVFLLPESHNGLDHLVRDLPYIQLLPLLNRIRESDVIVQIPKFVIDFDIDLVHELQKAGITEIFGDNADLSNMLTGKGRSRISGILHRAKIEVNEKGTTAGAGSAAAVVPLMTPQKSNEFIANHPFLFFIKDKEAGFLFEGQFVQPSATQSNNPSENPSYGQSTPPKITIDEDGGSHKPNEGPKRGSAQSLPYPPQPPQHWSVKVQPKDKDALQFNSK